MLMYDLILLKSFRPWNTPSRTKYKLFECVIFFVVSYDCAFYTPSLVAFKTKNSSGNFVSNMFSQIEEVARLF